MKFLHLMIVLVLCNNAYSQCAWDSNLITGDGEKPSIESSPCFSNDTMSVVWLENTGCKCVADVRIIGDIIQCDPSCQNTSYEYRITGVGSGSGVNHIGEHLSGSFSGSNNGPAIYFWKRMDVECNSMFTFNFSVECSCDDGGSPATTICSDGTPICGFSALCNQECSTANPPENIPVD